MSEEKYLINRIVKRTTKTGKTVVDLYGDPRLEFPVLTLFNLTELNVVDVDPNILVKNADHYTRFFAYWAESKKENGEGNLYKDVLYLEPCTSQPAANTDTEKILKAMRIIYVELREIRKAIEAIQTGKVATPPQVAAPLPLSENETRDLSRALSENDARDLFYALAGPAIATGQISAMAVNGLTQLANGDGWNEAVRQLQTKLK